MNITGATVDSIPTPRPLIIVVAGPVSDCCAILFTYLYVSEVYISVKNPIITPAITPAAIATKAPRLPNIDLLIKKAAISTIIELA